MTDHAPTVDERARAGNGNAQLALRERGGGLECRLQFGIEAREIEILSGDEADASLSTMA